MVNTYNNGHFSRKNHKDRFQLPAKIALFMTRGFVIFPWPTAFGFWNFRIQFRKFRTKNSEIRRGFPTRGQINSQKSLFVLLMIVIRDDFHRLFFFTKMTILPRLFDFRPKWDVTQTANARKQPRSQPVIRRLRHFDPTIKIFFIKSWSQFTHEI
jgi:hypothetical protein